MLWGWKAHIRKEEAGDTAAPIATYQGHNHAVRGVAMALSGALEESATNAHVQTFLRMRLLLGAGEQLASASRDGTVALWDLKTDLVI